MKITKQIKKNIILIGGGIMRNGETEKIDKWIIRKVSKKFGSARVLFIPLGSRDMPAYSLDFKKRYKKIGATVKVLNLTTNPSQQFINQAVLSSNLIYIGGGDPSLILKKFRKYDFDNLIYKQLQKNKLVLTGLSAGAIIWAEKFLNFKWNGKKFTNFRIQKGFGWFSNLIVPHFSLELVSNSKVKNLIYNSHSLIGIGERVAIYWSDKGNLKYFKTSPSDEVLIPKINDEQ